MSDGRSTSTTRPQPALRRILLPLALAQFICSFAGSNMNVMINDISKDLDTTVQGVQTAITIFLLVMAALMIPGGKLTDRYGRKRCFTVGLVLYGIGALLSAAAPGLGSLILGNSILEGVGTALLIPPVYILTTLLFPETTSRARAFGVISAMGGIGAAAGPLIGGLITTAISWRAAFVFQALVIAVIVLLSRKIEDPLPADPTRRFDTGGAVLSALGLVLIASSAGGSAERPSAASRSSSSCGSTPATRSATPIATTWRCSEASDAKNWPNARQGPCGWLRVVNPERKLDGFLKRLGLLIAVVVAALAAAVPAASADVPMPQQWDPARVAANQDRRTRSCCARARSSPARAMGPRWRRCCPAGARPSSGRSG